MFSAFYSPPKDPYMPLVGGDESYLFWLKKCEHVQIQNSLFRLVGAGATSIGQPSKMS